MAEGQLKNLTLPIAVLAFVISLVVMLFGDNLLGRSISAELNILTSQNDFQLPDKLNQIVTNNIDSTELQSIPDTIRIITLNNSGPTSRNLKVVLSLDGPIYQYKITSTEEAETQIVDGSNVRILMERLSKNAEISMIFWVRDENKEFLADYADDNESGAIEVNSLNDEKSSMSNNITLLLMIISIFVMFYELIKRMFGKFKAASMDNNKDLLNEMVDIYLDTNKQNEFEIFNNDVTRDDEDSEEKLRNMMEKLKHANIRE